VIPTKLLEYMSCERPVIVAVDGQARELVERASAGVFVEPENVDDLIAAIERLSADSEGRRRMGENGRRFIVEHLSREQTARDYIGVLKGLIHY